MGMVQTKVMIEIRGLLDVVETQSDALLCRPLR